MYNKKDLWSGIEVVITSYTGTVVVAKSGPWVRIPPTPPIIIRLLLNISKKIRRNRMKVGFTIGKFAPLHKRTSIFNRKSTQPDG